MTRLHSPRLRKPKGMTLIEVLMVLAILGLVVQMAAAGFGPALEAEKMRAVNQVVSTISYAYNRARVHGTYLRLEIDLSANKFSLQEASEAMYLPSVDRDGRIKEIDEDALKERDERDKSAAERFNESVLNKLRDLPGQVMGNDEAPEPSGDEGGDEGESEPVDPYEVSVRTVPRARPPLFSAFKDENSLSGLGAPIELPKGIRILGVRTDSDIQEIKEGKAYLYFFPSGRTQKANILIQDIDEAKVNDMAGSTITVSPLTGKVKVIPKLEHLELPEDFRGGKDDLGRELERRSF